MHEANLATLLHLVVLVDAQTSAHNGDGFLSLSCAQSSQRKIEICRDPLDEPIGSGFSWRLRIPPSVE